ncbi:MAG: hypothetical protein ACO25B_01400 [Chitinophagaceae bacterium]
MGKRIFFMCLFDKTAGKTPGKFLLYSLGNPFRFFHGVKAIGIGIIQAPDVMPDGKIDMCVFEGKLANSCRPGECRKYGSLLDVGVTTEEARDMIPGSGRIMD